jgi:hypothetical protein
MVTMALTKIQQREAADLNQRLLELVDDGDRADSRCVFLVWLRIVFWRSPAR